MGQNEAHEFVQLQFHVTADLPDIVWDTIRINTAHISM